MSGSIELSVLTQGDKDQISLCSSFIVLLKKGWNWLEWTWKTAGIGLVLTNEELLYYLIHLSVIIYTLLVVKTGIYSFGLLFLPGVVFTFLLSACPISNSWSKGMSKLAFTRLAGRKHSSYCTLMLLRGLACMFDETRLLFGIGSVSSLSFIRWPLVFASMHMESSCETLAPDSLETLGWLWFCTYYYFVIDKTWLLVFILDVSNSGGIDMFIVQRILSNANLLLTFASIIVDPPRPRLVAGLPLRFCIFSVLLVGLRRSVF